MTTAQNIRQARLRRGWTQEMLAQQVGVTLSSVQRWESGEAKPRTRKRDALAAALGVDPTLLDEPDAASVGDTDTLARLLHEYMQESIRVALGGKGERKYGRRATDTLEEATA